MIPAGNPYVRRMVWMLAIQAVESVPVYRDYFQQRTAAGKKKMHSVVAVGRKLLSVSSAVLKTGRPYQAAPEFSSHLAVVQLLTGFQLTQEAISQNPPVCQDRATKG
jgi:hypothetical protein